MKRGLSVIVGLLILGIQVSAQANYLPQTFTSSSGVFRIDYPADWDAYEVGPAIFWFTSPGTGQVWDSLPIGGARVSIALPAQNKLLGTHYDTSNFLPINTAGQTGYFWRQDNDTAPGTLNTRTVVLEYGDGQLAAVLHVNAADQAVYEPVFLAMLDTLQYHPGEAPTTSLPTAAASGAPETALGGFYYSPYFHLFFEYPKDWFIVEGSGGVQVLNYEYDNDGPNAPGEARVQFLPSGVLTQAGLNLDTSSPVTFLDDIRLLINAGANTQSEAAAMTLGDRPAARADGVFRGSKTVYLAVGSVAGEMLFITGEASEADFAVYEPLFLQIAATGVYKLPTFADPLPTITRHNIADMMRYFEFNSTRISSGQTEQVVFSPDGTLAANVSGSTGMHIWDTANGDLLNSFNVVSAGQIAFSPDNSKIAAVHVDAGLQIINRSNGQVTAVPSEVSLWSVDYSPDGTLITTGGRNGTVQLWSAETLEMVETLAQSEGAPIARVKFSPDGRWLAATAAAGTVSLWKVNGDRAQTDFTVWDDPAETGVAITFSQDGARLAVLATSGNYAVLDTSTGEVILSGRLEESVFYEGIALNGDGSVLAVILQEDGIIALIDVANGRTWARLSQGGDAVGSIAFSPDGTRLLAGGFYRNSLVLWAVGEE